MSTNPTNTAHARRVEADIGARVERQVLAEGRKLKLGSFLSSPEMRLILRLLAPRSWVIGGIVATTIVHTTIAAAVLLLAVAFINIAIAGAYKSGGSGIEVLGFGVTDWILAQLPDGESKVFVLFSLIVMLLVLSSALNVFQHYVALRLQKDMQTSIRMEVFDKFMVLDLRYFNENKLGDIAYLQNPVIGRFTNVLLFAQNLLSATLKFCAALIILTSMSLTATGLFVAAMGILYWALRGVNQKARKVTAEYLEKSRAMVSSFLEIAYGIRLIHQGGQEARARDQFLDQVTQSEQSNVTAQTYSAYARAVGEIGSVLIVLIGVLIANLLLGYDFFANIAFSIAYGLVALSAAMQAKRILDLRVSLSNTLPFIKIASDFFYATDHVAQNLETRGGHTSQVIRKSLSVRNLSFSYKGDHETIADVSLKFPLGTATAIVGLSGSGKSTLLEILANVQIPKAGQVLLDGIDIQTMDSPSYRQNIGYVTQEMIVFNDTIRKNICYFNPEASKETIRQALDIACAREFIEACEDGFDTVIGERGMLISGGQRQRLTLARALLQQAQVLLLDEATSALDLHTEAQILHSLLQAKKDKILIVAAHRLSAIRNFDNIIVMDNGRVVEQGTHDQLIIQDGIYHGLYRIQEISGPDAIASGEGA